MTTHPEAGARVAAARDLLTAIGPGPLHHLLTHDITTTVYMQILHRPRFRQEELDVGGVSQDQLSLCLQILEARGLVRSVDDGSWVVSPPEQALADHAGRLEEQARMVRASAPSLVRLYEDAVAQRPTSQQQDVGIQLLQSLDDVNEAMTDLFRGSRERVVSMRTTSPRVRLMMRQAPDRIGAPVLNRRGEALHLRVTFDATLVEEDTLPAAIAARLAAGDEIRFASSVPFTATTSDSGVTVVDIDDPRGTSVGVRITHPGITGALRRVIDDMWLRGVPWGGRKTFDSERVDPLDERDRDILALLLTGAADATIARQLKVSQRTVERRVRRMLELLDATTRFQAGAQAVRRGWI